MKYESSITYHSKANGQCKSFCRQTNRQTKNYMPLIYQCGSIKMLPPIYIHETVFHDVNGTFPIYKFIFKLSGASSIRKLNSLIDD